MTMVASVTIENQDHISHGLGELRRLDQRLGAVCSVAGEVPLRRWEPGFESLASIIISQQVSKASADAIFSRLKARIVPFEADIVFGCGENLFLEAGVSRPKQQTLRAVSHAILSNQINLEDICAFEAQEAIESLVAVRGIGRWTAEIYLMFAAGHPDIFPAGDIALRNAVGHAFGRGERIEEKELRRIAESWTPWRSVAARLFWRYYAVIRGREAIRA